MAPKALRSNLSALLRRGRQGTRSIRFKITFKIWLLLLVIFSLTNVAVNVMAARIVLERGHLYLGSTSTLFAFGLENWLLNIQKQLELEASLPAFRGLDFKQIQLELDRLAQLYPYRLWRVWSPSGELLAHTGKAGDPAAAQQLIIRSKHFQAARRGNVSYGAVKSSSMVGEDCLAYIVPIYRNGSLPAMAGRPADALLSFCLPLSSIKKDLSMDRLVRQMQASSVQTKSGMVSLDLVSQYLIGDNGVVIHLLGPHYGDFGRVVSQAKLVPVSQQGAHLAFDANQMVGQLLASSGPDIALHRLRWQGLELLSYTAPIEGKWRLVSLIGEDQVFASLRETLAVLLKLHILALALITISLYVSCGNLLKPLQYVAKALRSFRDGRFQLALPPHQEDEMGTLLEDLKSTGVQLEDLLSQHALLVRRDLQIETARRIQGDFLVKTLPANEQFVLAACSLPALDVGADWYDAMTMGDQTLIVVADVCDKGVGSALYMSVFRTLIRYGMQRALAEAGVNGEVDQPLSHVLGLVNDYMIGNHSGSAMFATAFVALFNESTGQLNYVLAGHEPPLVKHEHGLSTLEECGPALGLFSAAFVTRQYQLRPGDLLLAFSDGLLDARSPSDESFGLERVEQILLELPTEEMSAQETLDSLVARAREHIGEADQFDDLTVMTLVVQRLTGLPTASSG